MRALELNPERVPARALPIDLIAPWLVSAVGQRDIWRDALQFWQASRRIGESAGLEIREILRTAWLRRRLETAPPERLLGSLQRLIVRDDRSYYTLGDRAVPDRAGRETTD